MNDRVRKYIAEAIGTFVLVLFGCGSAVFGAQVNLGTLGIAFAFGLCIVAMAYCIGPVSGCHVNPAVSFAMWLNKRLPTGELIGYVISQTVGALCGSATIALILSLGIAGQGAGANLCAGGPFTGLIIEVILTFVFVLVILQVTGKKQGNSNFAGLVIGLTLVLIHILGIPLTGTSVNPARSLAPALFAGGEALAQVWVYIVGPMIGAALAAVVGKAVLSTEAK